MCCDTLACMSETPPTRKVVRRVVRKPVVLPGDDAPAERPSSTVVAPAPPAPAEPAAPSEPTEPVGPSRWQRVVTRASATGRSTGALARRALAAGSSRARGWRLPAWPDVVWAAVVGLALGLLVTAAGAGVRELFSATRGVSTGGGRWGSLALVLLCLAAVVLGELALRALRVPQPRATVVTAVLLVLMAVLAFFLEPVATAWAWLLLPALGAGATALAAWLLSLGRIKDQA